MPDRRVVVLYGGKSNEHSISCISAAEVLKAIDRERFDVIPIGITPSGQWLADAQDPREFTMGEGGLPVVRVTAGSHTVVLDMALGCDGFFARTSAGRLMSLGHVDVVFPVLHGRYGEDGTVQGLLDMMGVPYVGCGVLASAVCMDKHFTKLTLAAAGIPVTPGITVDTRELGGNPGSFPEGEGAGESDFIAGAPALLTRVQSASLRYPLFVKPAREGSSFGITRVEREGDAHELAIAVFEASRRDSKVLIEQGMSGREIECAVLVPGQGEEPLASLPGEIVVDLGDDGAARFYDFDSKYIDTKASHVVVPARLPEKTLQRVRRTAIEAFKAVDGTGMGRVDTFVSSEGHVTVNEINAIPGFTPISMYPKAWQATGVSYAELLTQLVEGALAETL